MATQYFSVLLTRHGGVKIIDVLKRKNIDFCVVGSTALAFHGLRPVSEVGDLDLLVRPPENKLQVLKEALWSIGVHSFSLEDDKTWHEPFMRHLPLKMPPYCCDLLTAQSESNYADLAGDAEQFSENGLSVQVASRRSLKILLAQVIATGDTDIKRANDLAALQRDING